jgi:amino acid transporter
MLFQPLQKNARIHRDLPRGMMWAIIICTVLYIVVALTGMVNYSELNVGDPLAFVFHKLDLKWMSSIVAVSAVIAMASFIGFPNGSTAYMDEYES